MNVFPMAKCFSYFEHESKHVIPVKMVLQGDGPQLWSVGAILDHVARCKANGWPVVLAFNAPDRPLWNGSSVSDLAAVYAAWWRACLTASVRFDLLVLDAEFDRGGTRYVDFVNAVVVPMLAAYPDALWTNYNDVLDRSIYTQPPGLPCQNVNDPCSYLYTWRARHSAQGRLGDALNRVSFCHREDPGVPVIGWAGSLCRSDEDATPDDVRNYVLHLLARTGGPIFGFDQTATPDDAGGRGYDEGAEFRAIIDTAVDDYDAVLAGRTWVKPLRTDVIHGPNDWSIASNAVLSDGSALVVETRRVADGKPIDIASGLGWPVHVPAAPAGSRTSMVVQTRAAA